MQHHAGDMTTTYSRRTRVHHYEIIRMLGHGGMNNVYLAQDILNQEKVVLKFPNDDLISNVGVFERYKREAEIGSRLHHPHVQRLLNTDEQRCEHYLLLEYILGRTLREILDAASTTLLPLVEGIRMTPQTWHARA